MGQRSGTPRSGAHLGLALAILAAAIPGLAGEVEVRLDRLAGRLEPRPRAVRCTAVTDLVVEEFLRSGDGVRLDEPTHVGFFQGLVVVTDKGGDRVVYRPEEGGTWAESPLDLALPHSVTRSTAVARFLAADSGHDRLLAFGDLGSASAQGATSVAGVTLDNPHDVLYDPMSGNCFALNAVGPTLFRLRDLGVDESSLDLDLLANYSRALSVVDGRVYVVASSLGRVLEVVDFDAGLVQVHQSFGFRQEAYAGSWATTGLILNDVERYHDDWYASSFFAPAWAGGTDHNRFKLIRFTTWEGFESGAWDDLSPLLPDAVVPYFFTVHDGSLYVATFHSQLVGVDVVYRFTAALFADGFECGDLGSWGSEPRAGQRGRVLPCGDGRDAVD